MLVDNIFKLINRFGAKEDQLSAGFGVVLKNNKKVLEKFLKKIRISVKSKNLNKIDIETQIAYDSGESRIDLQLVIPYPVRYLIFFGIKNRFYQRKHYFKSIKKI